MHHAVFLASKASNIHNLQQAKGSRLQLPAPDSMITYLAFGELNAEGIQAKSYFRKIDYSRYQDSALYTMNIGQADVVVVVGDLAAEKWLSQHPGAAILNTPPVPNLTLAVSKSLPGATVFSPMAPSAGRATRAQK